MSNKRMNQKELVAEYGKIDVLVRTKKISVREGRRRRQQAQINFHNNEVELTDQKRALKMYQKARR